MNEALLKRSREITNDAECALIGAGAGLSAAAGINYHDTKKFAEIFPGFVKRGFTKQYELIAHNAVNKKPGWTPAVKWGYLATHVNYVYYEIQKNPVYQNLYSIIKDKDYFVMTSNVDGLFVHNNFDENRIYTPQGSFSLVQCMKACTNETWDVKPIIDRILPYIDPLSQEVTDLSCIPACPNCGGDMFMNVRGGGWFIEKPYEHQKRALNHWISHLEGKKIVVFDIGTGFNTPGVIRWPAETIANHFADATLIRVNLEYPEVPIGLKDKAISLKMDASEFINGMMQD